MRWVGLFTIVAVLLVPVASVPAADAGLPVRSVCTVRHCWQAEVAERTTDRRKGLMNRQRLAPDSAMLFKFQREGPHPFWMLNTLIPLDIIWLDAGGRVVHVVPEARPCRAKCPRFASPKPASFVFEINAGQAAAYGIAVGTRFDLGEP